MYIESYEDWLRRKYPKQKPLFIFRCQQCYGTGKDLEWRWVGNSHQKVAVPCRRCKEWGECPMFDTHTKGADLFFRYIKEVRESMKKLEQGKETILK